MTSGIDMPFGLPRHMLAHTVKEGQDLEHIVQSDQWALQVKHNGVRAWLSLLPNNEKTVGTLRIVTRNGVILAEYEIGPVSYKSFFAKELLIDGECIAEEQAFIAFDIVQINSLKLFSDGFEVRNKQLELIESQVEKLVKSRFDYFTTATNWNMTSKYDRMQRARDIGGEGVMFRHRSSIYETRRSAALLKYKFRQIAYAFVTGSDGDVVYVSYFINNDEPPLQTSSTAVPYYGEPINPGTVVQVEYVWADRYGRLLEPTIVGELASKDISITRNQQIRPVRNI